MNVKCFYKIVHKAQYHWYKDGTTKSSTILSTEIVCAIRVTGKVNVEMPCIVIYEEWDGRIE